MLCVLGLSHHSAPVETRERIAFPDPVSAEILKEIAELVRGEALVLSTCNRVEIYWASAQAEASRDTLEAWLAARGALAVEALRPALFFHAGPAALHHLLRVASSLDSLVVGEPQILGQVKQAWECALAASTMGAELGRASSRAFQAAKRVRSETRIARSSVSVASAATRLAGRIFGTLEEKDLLVVGAGKMASLAARHFHAAGARSLHVVNRALARAEKLAAGIGGEAHPWEELESLLGRVDVVLCSTGAPRPVIDLPLAARALRARRGRWLCFIDIAVPRDVAPEVGRLENVYLYDIDQLSGVVEEHVADRQREATLAERIVVEELERWQRAERTIDLVPTIRALRRQFARVARAEVERALPKLGRQDQRARQALEALADGIVAKLLHLPLTALKRDEAAETLADAARTLFNLETESASEAEPVAVSEPVSQAEPAPAAAPPPRAGRVGGHP